MICRLLFEEKCGTYKARGMHDKEDDEVGRKRLYFNESSPCVTKESKIIKENNEKFESCFEMIKLP